jgi:hypothetical protein
MEKLQYLLYADGSQSLLVVLQALDAAGKDGTVRHVFQRNESAGHVRVRVQAAEQGRAGSRFSLARAPSHSGQRPGGYLQSLPLRGCPGGTSAQSRSAVGVVEALRPDQRFREDAAKKRNQHPQILPPHQPQGAAHAVRAEARRSRPETGRSAKATTPSASCGRNTWRRTRKPWL